MAISLDQQNQIWNTVLLKISDRMQDRHVFDSFFADTKVYKIEGNKIYILASSSLAIQFLQKDPQTLELVNDVISEVTQSDYEVEFVNKANIVNEEPSPKAEAKSPFFQSYSLNPKYTFDNYVVGDSNREAVQAALFIARNPGTSFNPLFIYSKTGLGKTHLIHALGNYIKTNTPNKKVLYITTDAFIDEFIKYSRGDQQTESFKDFMKTVDVLLVDDIQFLSEKVKTSEMFFNIFNILVNSNKQIVLTSDRHPNDLKGLEDRLVSRFNSGLSIAINTPDTNTMIQILKNKIEANGLDLSDFDEDGLIFLAENFNKNVRELESALNKVIFYTINVRHFERIDLNTIKEAVGGSTISKDKKQELTPDEIIEAVGDFYHLSDSQIKSKVRTSQIALARQISMYLLRNMLNMPYIQIGKIFSGRDHSTVMSSCEKVELMLKTDNQLSTALSQIQKNLKR
jgi:chromosomal replication initiator protein